MYNWSIMGLSDLVIGQSVFDLSVQIFCSDSWQRYFLISELEETVLRKLPWRLRMSRRTTGPWARWWIGLTAVFIFRKSTFFNVLTKSQAAAENFPFCTIDPNESRVPIPDQRYDFLCRFHKPARYGGVTPFTNYSHVGSVILDDLLAVAAWKDVTMLLTCSCQVFSPLFMMFFVFLWRKSGGARSSSTWLSYTFTGC